MTGPEATRDPTYHDLAAKHVSASRIIALCTPYKLKIAMVICLILLCSAVGMASPFLLREIIDEALPKADMSLLAYLAGELIGVAALTAGLNTLQIVMSIKIGQSIMHDLRVRLYSHLQSLSLPFFSAARSGEIQSRIARDIGGLQTLVTNTANELARNFSIVVMTTIAMFLLDWRLALFSMTAVAVSIILSDRVGKMRKAITHEHQVRLGDMSAAVQESLSISGVILARTMGRGAYLARRFTRTSKDVARLEVRSHTAGEWQWQLFFLVLSMFPAFTLLLGGLLMNAGVPATIGTLVAMIVLQEQLLWPLQGLLENGSELRTTRALFTRVFEYLDKPVEINEKPDAIILDRQQMKGAVRLENVGFSYPGSQEPTLSDVSIDIPAGSSVAIVGATGSGKTTLGYLLARLYDVNAGEIRYDNVDVRTLSFETVTDLLGVVTQEPYLLYASVAENLRFAKPDATDQELIAAAKIAQIHYSLSTLPEGYDTLVGDRGYRFSAEEKQRLALARTILRNPPILLLDETTRALDTRSERAMEFALAALSKGRTTITIAHRLSTIRHADQIVVLRRGRVVEKGTHTELTNLNGIYAALIKSEP